ncbi:uncharacterized protein LOC143281946 [Babylonia areolata]|uniref:uncharacterized protein LOC143281946 n=1 Tax=Babylonia areolata TaxID=304850 RepID=UPI003FCF0922
MDDIDSSDTYTDLSSSPESYQSCPEVVVPPPLSTSLANPIEDHDPSHPIHADHPLPPPSPTGSDHDHGEGAGVTVTPEPLPDPYSASVVSETCVCEVLKQVLHQGCQARSERAASVEDQFFDQFNLLQSPLQPDSATASVYRCPQHGALPEQVMKSICPHCHGIETLSASLPQAGNVDDKDKAGSESAVTGSCCTGLADLQYVDVGEGFTHKTTAEREVDDIDGDFSDDETATPGVTTGGLAGATSGPVSDSETAAMVQLTRGTPQLDQQGTVGELYRGTPSPGSDGETPTPVDTVGEVTRSTPSPYSDVEITTPQGAVGRQNRGTPSPYSDVEITTPQGAVGGQNRGTPSPYSDVEITTSQGAVGGQNRGTPSPYSDVEITTPQGAVGGQNRGTPSPYSDVEITTPQGAVGGQNRCTPSPYSDVEITTPQGAVGGQNRRTPSPYFDGEISTPLTGVCEPTGGTLPPFSAGETVTTGSTPYLTRGTPSPTSDVETTGSGSGVGEVSRATPSPVEGGTEGTLASAGGINSKSDEEKKLLKKASKKLMEMSSKLKFFLKETALRGKDVQKKLHKIESNKSEVEKALSDHVKYLHSLLDYHHSEQQEELKQKHKDFLQQLMVTKTDELNFEARLTDVQQKVEDALQRVTQDGDLSVASPRFMDDLCDQYHRRVSSRPGKKEHGLTYMVEIPQVTADEIQSLLGHYMFPGHPHITRPSPPYPAPRWPGYEDVPRGHSTSSKASSSSTSSQHSYPPFKNGTSTKPQPPKASSAGPGRANSPLPKNAGGGDSTEQDPPTKEKSSTFLRFSKEQRAKEAAKRSSSTTSGAGASSGELSTPVQAKGNSASLGSKQKLSEMMASSSSIASTGSTKKKTRTRRKKTKKAEAKKEALEPVLPTMITLLHEKERPKKLDGRLKQAKGFSARPNGELWVVYGVRDPHLDRINEEGDILEAFRIGGNAMHAASFSDENVLLSLHSPFCQLRLLDAQKETRETFKLPLIPTGLGVGTTGIAVCSYRSVYWIPLDGGRNEWIVKEKGSTLKNACSCDVLILRGREIVCIADSEGHKVWFYEKLENGEFAPLPLFTYASHEAQGKTVPFSPVCLSSLTGSPFLAVLDSTTRSVLMVDVQKNEVVSVISRKQLCDGNPSVICFALTSPGEDPKLWVASDAEYIYQVSLAFLY